MKINLARQTVVSTLLTNIVISVVGLFALLRVDESRVALVESTSMLSDYIVDFQHAYPIVAAIATAAVILLVSSVLGRIISVTNIYGTSSTIQLYVLTVVMWCVVLNANFLLSATLLLLFTQMLSSLLLSVHNPSLSYIFNAALPLSLLPLIYTPALTLWVVSVIVFMIRGLGAREFIVYLTGLLLPATMIFYLYWLFGDSFDETLRSFFALFWECPKPFVIEDIALFPAAILAISALLLCLSLFWINTSIHKTLIRIKIILAMIAGAASTLCSPSANALSIVLAATPIAIFAAMAMAQLRPIVTNILYLIYLLLISATIIYPIYIPVG